MKISKGNVEQIGDCQIKCSGSVYFAMQGFSCYCGNAYSTAIQYSLVANADCVVANKTLYWGNSITYRNAIYRHQDYLVSPITVAISSNAKVSLSQYLGCYIDDDTRDVAITSQTVTSIEGCQSLCVGYAYFAVQVNQCFCGNKYATQPRFSKVSDSDCGGPGSMGSTNRNSIYKSRDYKGPANVAVTTAAPIVTESQFKGCYIDDLQDRNLKKYAGKIKEMGECQNKCAGYRYFSIQTVSLNERAECYCGNTYGPTTAAKYALTTVNVCDINNNGRSLHWGDNARNAV